MTAQPLDPPSGDGLTVDLLATDRELAGALPGDAGATALVVPALEVKRGDPVPTDATEAAALMLVDGALWREVAAGRSVSPQVLHPGAVLLRPLPPRELLDSCENVAALTDARLAVLDAGFLASIARWPGLAGILHRRLAEQERALALHAAIGAMPRVDDRLLILLWHLAEHWGRVVPDGVKVVLNLTHATLGRFVGARRPTVSIAVSELRDRGELDRDDLGHWILTGSAPTCLACSTGGPERTAGGMPDLFPRGTGRRAA